MRALDLATRAVSDGRRLLTRTAATVLLATVLTAQEGAPVLLSTTGSGKAAWSTLAELQAAAAKDDPAACLELGIRHEFGREVAEDQAEARSLYTRAARAGLPEADFRLGRLLSEGLGGPADLPASFAHYLRAARAGLPLAQYNVGAMLASARGVKRDYVEGLAWIILATRDADVDPEGEKKLRARLSHRPQDIAAAELRVIALQHELEAAKEQPSGARPAANAAPVRRPPFAPALGPAQPVVEVPAGSLPGLPVAPPAPALPPPK